MPSSMAPMITSNSECSPALVALGARQAALLGPAAVAVHDQGHVPGHQLGRDGRRPGAAGVRVGRPDRAGSAGCRARQARASCVLHVPQRPDRVLQVPLQVRGDQPAALDLMPALAGVGPASHRAAARSSARWLRRRRGRPGAWQAAAGQTRRGADPDREARQRGASARSAGPAVPGRRRPRTRPAPARSRPRPASAAGKRPAPAADRASPRRAPAARRPAAGTAAAMAPSPPGSAARRSPASRCRRCTGVVAGQRLAVRPEGLGLGDHVQRPAGVQQQVDMGERLEPGAEPATWSAARPWRPRAPGRSGGSAG